MIYTTISDAWFHLLKRMCTGEAYKQTIQKGSFAGEAYRCQLPFAAFSILYPTVDCVPVVPNGVAPPTTEGFIQEYFLKYILGTEPAEANEDYNYSDRIQTQLPGLMDLLSVFPQTNQATISVSMPSDFGSDDPPCLREIDFKVVGDRLDLAVFFRSNDLWAAFPTNLGAIGKLQALVAEWIEVGVGSLHYASAGMHVYNYQIDMVKGKLGVGQNEKCLYQK